MPTCSVCPWRPVFLANIGLGVVGLIIAGRTLPRDDAADRSTVAGGGGSGMLSVTMIGLLFGLIERLDPRRSGADHPGLIASGFAAMGRLVVKLGRTLVFIGLTVDLIGCG